MSLRKFKLNPNDWVVACPKCGNNREFSGYSRQVCEDGCETWVECNCGFDPTSWDNLGSMYRVESVWGGLDQDSIMEALGAWNDAVGDYKEKQTSEPTK